jgi:hypothetical protein
MLSRDTGDRAGAEATPAASEILGQLVTFTIPTGQCDIRHPMRGDCRRDKNSRNRPKGQNDRTDDHRRLGSMRAPSAASVGVVVTTGDCRRHGQ